MELFETPSLFPFPPKTPLQEEWHGNHLGFFLLLDKKEAEIGEDTQDKSCCCLPGGSFGCGLKTVLLLVFEILTKKKQWRP